MNGDGTLAWRPARLLRRLVVPVARLVEDVYGWRSYAFGRETAGYAHTVMVRTYVEWRQVGAAVRWDPDEDSWHVHALVGPFGACATVGRREVLADLPDEVCRSREFRVGGRTVQVYRLRRHIGVAVQWSRYVSGLVGRLEVGPLGIALEPR